MLCSVSSVTQSCLTLCDSNGLQHVRLPCPFTNSRSLLKLMSIELVMQSNHISSSVVPFSSCPKSFPASGSFLMSLFFASGGQNIGSLASASVLPMNIQDRFPLGWSGGSPHSPRDSQESSPTTHFKSINSSVLRFLYSPTLTYMTTGKTIALIIWTLVGKVTSLLVNALSAWSELFFQGASVFNIMAAVTISSDIGTPQNKVCNCFHCFSIHLT